MSCLEFLLIVYRLVTIQAQFEETNQPSLTENGEILWEGDMILSKDQIESMYGGRKARDDLKYRWTGGKVPFAISQSSEEDRHVILEAIDHWREHSCLIFDEVPEYSRFPHLIFKKGNGCHSQVGMHAKEFPNGQEVSIGPGCALKGKIAHEIGHAIGFYHEQSRPERDNYIMIKEENIKEGHMHNFNIHNNINDYGVPYDVGSIMHYHSKEFTTNGKNTIVTVDIMQQSLIGQRKTMSFYDMKLANVMYNCSNYCSLQRKCKNGGFTDHKCRCQCPPGFTGKFCEEYTKPSEPECGGIILSPQVISTPNYPDNYPVETNCIWWIQAPSNQLITVSFDTFQVGYSSSSGHCHDGSLEMRIKNVYDGTDHCGDELTGKSIVSIRNEMVLFLWNKHGYNDQGFRAEIKFHSFDREQKLDGV